MTQEDAFTLAKLTERVATRRSVLKFAVATAGTLGVTGLLAACGGDDDDDDDDGGTTPAATSGTSSEPTATTAASGGASPETTASAGTSDEPTATAAAGAPTTATGGGEGKQGGTLTLGFNVQQLLQLDPARISTGRVAGQLSCNLSSALVQFDETLAIQPDLAESWEVSDDGLVYTFHLRDGLTFHNGDPLKAEDFVYTFNRTQDEALASPHANKLANINKAEAVDELTFEMTFNDPFGPFLAVACSRGPGRALAPIPKRAVDEIGEDEFLLKPVGSGPFMLVPDTMDPQGGFEMVAFENWYGGRPFLDKIVVKFIPEPASQANALAAGDIDMINEVPAQGWDQLEGADGVVLEQSPGTNWIGLQFNTTRPPWDQIDARLAIAKAINKDEFVEKARFGLADPSHGAIAPAFAWAFVPLDQLEENPQAYDLDEAKSMAEATGVLDAKPKLLTGAADDRNEQQIRNQLQDLGIDVELDKVEDAVYNDRWQNGDYDWAINGSVVDADPDDNDFNFFYPDGPWNTGKWNNDQAKQLLDAERATSDQDARAKAFQDLMYLTLKEAPLAFLYHQFDMVGYRDFVKDYVKIPEMRYLERVWLDK
ncbi:MAG TPA: ABC transporter substrate-binding protein [Thermomicrobiales bacterium]|nr:ABC transporter substrate-binding protein [Thermomicrobiales bacterium]